MALKDLIIETTEADKMEEDHQQAKDHSERESLADAINRISDGMNALLADGLNERAIVALLRDHTKIGKRQIKAVLAGLAELKEEYCSNV